MNKYDGSHFYLDVTSESNGILETSKMLKMYLISEKIRKRPNSVDIQVFSTELNQKRGYQVASKGKINFPSGVDKVDEKVTNIYLISTVRQGLYIRP